MVCTRVVSSHHFNDLQFDLTKEKLPVTRLGLELKTTYYAFYFVFSFPSLFYKSSCSRKRS